MNAHQRMMCRRILQHVEEAKQDPEHERKYQEWLEQRKKRRDPATNDSRATPIEAMTVYQTTGNAARSGAA